MPSIDFEVYCSACGEGLCNLTKVETRYGGTVTVNVGSCPKCKEQAREDGYTEGYDEGYEKAKEELEAV